MARAVQTQGVGVAVRPRLATDVGRSNNAWMRAISPTHVGSTVMLTDIKPDRNKRPGRTATTSNSGLQAAASVAALARRGDCDCRPRILSSDRFVAIQQLDGILHRGGVPSV